MSDHPKHMIAVISVPDVDKTPFLLIFITSPFRDCCQSWDACWPWPQITVRPGSLQNRRNSPSSFIPDDVKWLVLRIKCRKFASQTLISCTCALPRRSLHKETFVDFWLYECWSQEWVKTESWCNSGSIFLCLLHSTARDRYFRRHSRSWLGGQKLRTFIIHPLGSQDSRFQRWTEFTSKFETTNYETLPYWAFYENIKIFRGKESFLIWISAK